MRKGARFDQSRRYRYLLWRWWDPARPRIAFVMLNPSTADHRVDDPTIRRCIGFARGWKFGSLAVVNLFAYQSKSPAVLLRIQHPIGPQNDRYLRRVCRRADTVIAAWGNHGEFLGRDRVVRAMLAACCQGQILCLGTTRSGHPRHPLYLPGQTQLEPFNAD